MSKREMLIGRVLALGKSTFTDTSRLSHAKWLELRKLGIGGSDAGAIMYASPYATPLTVYMAKKEAIAEDTGSTTESKKRNIMLWGNIMEKPIMEKTSKELDIEISKVGGTFINIQHPYMRANLDGLVYVGDKRAIGGEEVEGLGGFEIKTSKRGVNFGHDEIPDSYYYQVQHYMAVTGLDWFLLTVFIFDAYEAYHYIVRRNVDVIRNMMAMEESFWKDFIFQNIPPAPVGEECEDAIISKMLSTRGGEIVLDEDMLAVIDARQEVIKKIEELKSQKMQAEEKLKLAIIHGDIPEGENIKATCGKYKISYNSQTRSSVDTAALRSAGLYDKYSKKTSYRVLRIGEAK